MASLSLILLIAYPFMLVIAKASEDKLITIRVYFLNKSIYVSFHVGEQNYLRQLDIDIDSQFTVAYPYSFHNNLPNTTKVCNWKREIVYNNSPMMANEAKDNFILSDDSSCEVSFFIIDRYPNNQPTSKFGAIGLSSSIQEEDLSLLHIMKKNGLISKLAFSLILTAFDKTYLSFGGIPQSAISNSQYQFCHLQQGSKWACKFRELFITFNEENSIDYFLHVNKVNAPARFSLKEWNILAPRVVYEELIDYVQFKATKKDKCAFMSNPKTNMPELECLCSIKETFKESLFVFEDMEYSLNESSIFWSVNSFNKCIFNVAINPEGDGWVFGYSFLKQFTTLFDYEERKIYFYRHNGSLLSNNEAVLRPASIKSLLILICLVMLIISICMQCYIKFKCSHTKAKAYSV